jgi:hypothetical protein
VLHTDDDDLRGEYQQLILEDDTDSEPSDVMDMSTRHRLRRVHERRSRTSDDTRFNIPTSSSTTLRKPSPELANARGQRTHGGKIRRWI